MRLLNLFGHHDNPQEEARQAALKERQEASQASLKAGGLPLDAIDRLREQASRQGTPGHLFTGDLSVNELMLMRQSGYQVLGQIMGSSIYQVGIQWRNYAWRNSVYQQGAAFEMDVMTQAFYNARHLALGRLQQEAALLGATGIVGVRLEHRQYDWGMSLLEFKAIGTAIRELDAPRPADGHAKPFAGALSGEEFWALRQSGFRPVGFAIGNCTYYQVPSWNTQQVTAGGFFGLGSFQNQELIEYTQALYNARELAMTRMERKRAPWARAASSAPTCRWRRNCTRLKSTTAPAWT